MDNENEKLETTPIFTDEGVTADSDPVVDSVESIDEDTNDIYEEAEVVEVAKPKKEYKYKPGRSSRSEEKRINWPILLLSMALVLSISFGTLQSVYIFKLTSGQTGIMTYLNGREDQKKPAISSDVQESPIANPSFSLEEAASVRDPNKTTLSTIEIVNSVSPATVSIYILNSDDITTPVSSGSGFIISEDGYVVTNAHVVDTALSGTDSVKVILADDATPIDAEIVGADEQTDVAVVKLAERDEPYPTVVLGESSVLQAGELVVAIGNPLGTLSGTVTVGVVSGLGRQFNNNGYTVNLIQTDASINHGNSGGPLINSFGEVIGITNAKMSSAEGLGFAIPIDDVRNVIQSIINYGYVANRPWLGISVRTEYENAFYGAVEGIYVAEITEDGPGDVAGFKIGDRIISMDGIEINESSDIIFVRDQHAIGEEISVIVDRDGREVELTLIVGDSYLGR